MHRLLGPIIRSLDYTFAQPVREEPRILPLALSVALMQMGGGLVSPILPLLVDSYGLTATMVGLAVSAFALARVLANIPAGLLTRAHGARTVLILGALLSMIGNVLIAIVPSYVALLAFRFIAGIGSAMFITGAVIYVVEVSSPQNRGRLMSLYSIAFGLGISLGPPVGGLTAAAFGLKAPFLLVGIVSGASGFWSFLRIPAGVARVQKVKVTAPTASARAESNRVEGHVGTRSGPHNPDGVPEGAHKTLAFMNASYVAVLLLEVGLFFTRGGALFNLWPLLGKERFAMGPGQIGLYFLIPSMTNIIAQPFAGTLGDRFGRKSVLMPAAFVLLVALLISAWLPHSLFFALSLGVYGAAQAVLGPLAASYIADVVPSGTRAVAISFYRTMSDLGLMVGSPMLGLIADVTSIPWALTINAALLLPLGIVFMLVAKDIRPTGPEPKAARSASA